MNQVLRIRGAALAALFVISSIQLAHADGFFGNSALPPGVKMASGAPVAQTATVPGAPGEGQATASDVAELKALFKGTDLAELRTTYNGSYGASLMFYGKELTYYVVLFQQKNFWRVIKTRDDRRAESLYLEFAHQSQDLADVEIRRSKLEAQKAYTDRMLAVSQTRASRLQADLEIARQQQALVASRQQEASTQANALETEQQAAQQALLQAQRQEAELQRLVDGSNEGSSPQPAAAAPTYEPAPAAAKATRTVKRPRG